MGDVNQEREQSDRGDSSSKGKYGSQFRDDLLHSGGLLFVGL